MIPHAALNGKETSQNVEAQSWIEERYLQFHLRWERLSFFGSFAQPLIFNEPTGVFLIFPSTKPQQQAHDVCQFVRSKFQVDLFTQTPGTVKLQKVLQSAPVTASSTNTRARSRWETLKRHVPTCLMALKRCTFAHVAKKWQVPLLSFGWRGWHCLSPYWIWPIWCMFQSPGAISCPKT